MSRTNIEIDDELIEAAMRRHGLKTKRDAVDVALRRLVGPKVTTEEFLALEGIGWEGDSRPDAHRRSGAGMTQYLIDTSVWIDFFRATPGTSREIMPELAADTDSIATTEPVIMELRAGAVGTKLARIEGTLNRFTNLGIQAHTDFFAASDLYRQVRRTGCTVRSMVECLIAAVAIRTEATPVHRDKDYVVLADIAADLRVRSALG